MQSPGYGIKYLLLITNICKSIFFLNVPYAYSERLKYLFKVYVEAVLIAPIELFFHTLFVKMLIVTYICI